MVAVERLNHKRYGVALVHLTRAAIAIFSVISGEFLESRSVRVVIRHDVGSFRISRLHAFWA